MTDRKQSGPGPAVEGDAELITAARGGDSAAFGALYIRHVDAARRLARSLARDPADVDDLVAEAFAKLLSTLRDGGGPDLAFRAYLLTALRNTFYDRIRRDRRLEVTADFSSHDPGVPFVDTAVEGLERSLAARAFARLPERWQMVLWHLEVEGETPAEVAPLLGLTPNGVSALAYRARERLRQAYLQEHIADHAGVDCDWTAERLGAHVRGGLSRRETARVQDHLGTCPRCNLLYVELVEVNSGLRGLLAPLVLGSAAAGYLLEPGKAAAAVVAGSGAAGGGAAGAAGAGGSGAAGSGAAGSGAAGSAAAGQAAGEVAAQGGGQAAAGIAGQAGAAGAAGAAGGGMAAPAVAVLHAGRGAARWARRIATQSGPAGVATGSAVGAAIIAVVVGGAIFAGTRPEGHPPPPTTAESTPARPSRSPAPEPPGVAIVPTPAVPAAAGDPTSSPTGEPSPTVVPPPAPTDAAGEPSATPSPDSPPTLEPQPVPAPPPTPGPDTPPPGVDTPPPGADSPPAPTRPFLAVRVTVSPLTPLLPGGSGVVAVTVTVGAPGLGVPEREIPVGVDTGPLRLLLGLPAGVRLGEGAPVGGWACADSACRHAPLTAGSTSTTQVPLVMAPDARGDLTFTVSAPDVAASTATLDGPG
ncbi:MAG TPA: sigma-70 family RNA polymerase sigma factor [Mycobacteriales bacterium]|nr:sigma-70 family RNA polymerase sigma factor [Mycobacteriales bacterium]